MINLKNSMEERLNNTEEELTEQEEKALYGKAKKRVQFTVHLMIYILTNSILWLFYSFVFRPIHEGGIKDIAFRFVLFVSLVWGIVVVAHYLIVYKWGKIYVEKEFRRLKKDHKKVKNEESINDF